MCYLPRETQQLAGFEPWHSVSSHVLRPGLSMAGVLRGVRGSRGLESGRWGSGATSPWPACSGLTHAGTGERGQAGSSPAHPTGPLHSWGSAMLEARRSQRPPSVLPSSFTRRLAPVGHHLALGGFLWPHPTSISPQPSCCLRNAPEGHPQETQHVPWPLVPPWAQASLKPHRPVLDSAPPTIPA